MGPPLNAGDTPLPAPEVDRRPAGWRLLAGAAAVLAATVLLVTVVRDDRPSAGDPTVGAVVRVGVRDGDSIPGYVQASRRELAALATPSAAPAAQPYALVTLVDYLTAERLAAVLESVAVSAVQARVPLPGVQTQIVRIPAFRVPADVVAGMLDVAARKDREVADYRRLIAGLPTDGAQQQRRDFYAGAAEVAAAEADAYRQRCACLYAAVVRAPAAVLNRIAARPEVRTVDPAPEVDRLDRAVFLPPLPEQTDVVRPPADDRLPGAGPSPRSDVPPLPSATARR